MKQGQQVPRRSWLITHASEGGATIKLNDQPILSPM
jgi:hypothetical protein